VSKGCRLGYLTPEGDHGVGGATDVDSGGDWQWQRCKEARRSTCPDGRGSRHGPQQCMTRFPTKVVAPGSAPALRGVGPQRSRGAPVPHTPLWRGMSGRVDDRRMAPKQGHPATAKRRRTGRASCCSLDPAVLHVTRAVRPISRSVRDHSTRASNKVSVDWCAGRIDHRGQLPQLPLRCVEMERSIPQPELTNDGRVSAGPSYHAHTRTRMLRRIPVQSLSPK